MSRIGDTSTIDQVLADGVAKGAVPNVAAIAADRDGVIYEGAAGTRVAGGDDPVPVDTHFRIMSMTKIVATVAALQQVERGTLDLDAPIDSYRPEFADLQVLDGFAGDTPRLRAPATRATVRQLLTHTAGLGYWFWNADLVRWEAATGTPKTCCPAPTSSSPHPWSPTPAPASSTASTPTGSARWSRPRAA